VSGQVDLADVEAWIRQASGDGGGAVIGDPYQAASMIQRLRDASLRVKLIRSPLGPTPGGHRCSSACCVTTTWTYPPMTTCGPSPLPGRASAGRTSRKGRRLMSDFGSRTGAAMLSQTASYA
jgi:hypothetical protein